MSEELEGEEASFELEMPFVVCDDQGGPYQAHAFVAGVYFGQIQTVVKGGGAYHGYVPSALVPQLDLLAMHHALPFVSAPWEDDNFHSLVTIGVTLPEPEPS